MKRLPFFASIDPSVYESKSREGNIALIRNSILQSDNSYKIGGWNKANLINSIQKHNNRSYCVSCVSVLQIGDNKPVIYLDSGEKFTLEDFIITIRKKEYPLNILFIYCESDIEQKLIHFIENAHLDNFLIVISTFDKKKFLFALSCELINWWEMASAKSTEVTFKHIKNCIVRVIVNYSVNSKYFKFNVIDNFFNNKDLAWLNGSLFAQNVDIEKIKDNARSEQIVDTIKRIFDSANHPRNEHLLKKERLISSQGLFWLSEIEDINDVKEWIINTRFYFEINSNEEVYHASFALVPKAQIDSFELREIFDNFIEIPAGEYIFGSKDITVDSEPPADFFKGYLEKYSILRFPVTNGFWGKIIDEKTKNELPNLPVVNVNYFQVLKFIDILNEILTEKWPVHFSSLKVRLPTEYQWEAAAKGKENFNYPWGNEFDEKFCNCSMLYGHSSNIGKFSPFGDSPFGCADMAGNVREWTRSYGGTRGLDWRMHSRQNLNDVSTQITLYSRVIVKGGSYSYSSDCVQTWVRNTQIASRSDIQTGFRLVLEKV